MNKTNEYNYVPNQVNIRIRIRIRDIRFASYPTTSESVFVSELKCGKKYYPNLIPYASDPIRIRSDFILNSNDQLVNADSRIRIRGMCGVDYCIATALILLYPPLLCCHSLRNLYRN